jgi:hypothetical protein
MKATANTAAVPMLLGALLVCAQNSAFAASPSVVIPVGGGGDGGGYADYPYTYHSSTVQEGYARGIADVIRSAGDYNLSTSAAAVNFSQARQQEIENQKKWTQAYFDIRNINRQAFDAEQKRQRASPEDWIRYAQAGRPKRLSASELDSVTGEIHWPMLLTVQDFSPQRVELQKAFSDRAYHGVMGADVFLRVLQVTDDLLSSLKTEIGNLPADKYVAAKRFLQSLAFEAGQPAG